MKIRHQYFLLAVIWIGLASFGVLVNSIFAPKAKGQARTAHISKSNGLYEHLDGTVNSTPPTAAEVRRARSRFPSWMTTAERHHWQREFNIPDSEVRIYQAERPVSLMTNRPIGPVMGDRNRARLPGERSAAPRPLPPPATRPPLVRVAGFKNPERAKDLLQEINQAVQKERLSIMVSQAIIAELDRRLAELEAQPSGGSGHD